MRHSTRVARAACYLCAILSAVMSETCFRHNRTWDLSPAVNLLLLSPDMRHSQSVWVSRSPCAGVQADSKNTGSTNRGQGESPREHQPVRKWWNRHHQFVSALPCHDRNPTTADTDPGFWSGGPAEFWPQGGTWTQNLLKIGGFPRNLPENCKKILEGKGGPGPQAPWIRCCTVSTNSPGMTVLTACSRPRRPRNTGAAGRWDRRRCSPD